MAQEKILVSGDLIFSEGCALSGDIDVVVQGNITINNSTIGTSLTNNCVLYSNSDISINESTVYGIIICNGNSLRIMSSSTIFGAVYTQSSNTEIISSALTGSIVSKHSLSLINSNLTKGSLPQIFGTSYGFKKMIIPGSFKEF